MRPSAPTATLVVHPSPSVLPHASNQWGDAASIPIPTPAAAWDCEVRSRVAPLVIPSPSTEVALRRLPAARRTPSWLVFRCVGGQWQDSQRGGLGHASRSPLARHACLADAGRGRKAP